MLTTKEFFEQIVVPNLSPHEAPRDDDERLRMFIVYLEGYKYGVKAMRDGAIKLMQELAS